MTKTFAGFIVVAAVCLAQEPPPAPPPPPPPPQVMESGQITAAVKADGGPVLYVSTQMDIGGPTVKNAPFAAEVSNERVQTLADGNHMRNTTTGRIYRDSEGRVRREENFTLVGPWSTSGQSQDRVHVTINDPVAGVSWFLDPEQKIAHKLPNPAERKVTGGGVGLSMGPQDVAMLKQKLAAEHGSGNMKTENLGTQMFEGIAAEGTRTTITIPAGAMGNERPIDTVSERWYSSELQMVVMSTVKDPRMGDSTYKLTNITRGDQPASLFQVPSDYQVAEPHGEVSAH